MTNNRHEIRGFCNDVGRLSEQFDDAEKRYLVEQLYKLADGLAVALQVDACIRVTAKLAISGGVDVPTDSEG